MNAKYIAFGKDGYDTQVYELEARNYSMDVYNRLIDRGLKIKNITSRSEE